jgi:DNA-binding response OmpR family regulator
MTKAECSRQILLAEKQPYMEAALRARCEERGWRVDAVTDVAEFLSVPQLDKYQSLIAACSLPLATGTDLVRTLSQRNPAQVIFVVDSSGADADVCALLQQGVRVYFRTEPAAELADLAARRICALLEEGRVQNGWQGQCTEYTLTTAEVVKSKFDLAVVENLLSAGLIDEAQKLRIELAFQEALANAVEHGNLELLSEWKDEFDEEGVDRYAAVKERRLVDRVYASRLVSVRVNYGGSLLKIGVKDEGRGFDFSRAPRRKGEDDLHCHGRGLALIDQIVDRLVFAENGREICMEIEL